MNNNYHFIDLCRLSRKVPDALALIGGSLCKGNADDKLSLDFHYCPLVKGWQKMGCTDEEIAVLCDIAMCGDHGIGEQYDAVLDLPKCIAKGDDICALRYRKK